MNEPLDLLGRLRRALREFPHLLGDNGETLARFPCTGRLDAGIQREKVCLESDLVDHADDIGNLLRAFLDLAHGLFRMGNDLGGLCGRPVGLAGDAFGFIRALAGIGDIDGDFVECRCRFLQRGGLLFGALGKIVRPGRDFPRSGVEVRNGVRDFRKRRAELGDGLVEIVTQRFEIRCKGLVDLEGEVAGGKALQAGGKA